MLFRHVQTDIWVNYVQFVKWLSMGGNFMGIYNWTSLSFTFSVFCYYFAFVIIFLHYFVAVLYYYLQVEVFLPFFLFTSWGNISRCLNCQNVQVNGWDNSPLQRRERLVHFGRGIRDTIPHSFSLEQLNCFIEPFSFSSIMLATPTGREKTIGLIITLAYK